ncbi:MAG: ABC-type multidrug transport system ATPase subunit [Halieaceae bacterium]|jgi:ABC-type multidrug transport system ATPase subunit
MLELENLSITYGSNSVFEDVNLSIATGEMCCIRTGVLDGSTSLLKCAAGLIEPNSGSCKVDGMDVAMYDDDKLLSTVCYCYEAGGLVSLFSVYENIVLPLVYHQNVLPRSLEETVREVAGALYIGDCLDMQVHELNDVQTRLVNLARGVVVGAKLLLLDELQEGMSVEMRKSVLGYLKKLRDDSAVTVIMSTTAGDDTTFADRLFSIEHKGLREEH